MVESTPFVLLFDIDGTLANSGGAGGGALLDALVAEFSLESAEQVPLHGRTDLGITAELLEKHGIEPSDENRKRLCQHYYRLLPTELKQRQGQLLPGVVQLLDALQGIEGCHLALMTGNMPESAEIKMRHFGLWDYFGFGVYGDLAPQRPELAEPARQIIQTKLRREEFDGVVIGDTPLDIELAKCMGLRSLAVCTGGFSEAELTEAGADLVMQDLSDAQAVRKWLLG
ncbi:MAG: HAD hydrolase-like protein [Planctomycetota bacterium]